MKPTSEMSASELNDAAAVEVFDCHEEHKPGMAMCWVQPDGYVLSECHNWFPESEDAQALQCLDAVAKLVGTTWYIIEYDSETDGFSHSVTMFYESGFADTRPRALTECAVNAARAWRERQGKGDPCDQNRS